MDESRLFQGLKIVYFFTLLVTPVTLMTRILFARVMTVEDYGLFYAFIGFFSLAYLLVVFGLDTGLTHYMPKLLAEKKHGLVKKTVAQIFLFQTGFATIVLIAIYLFRVPIAGAYFHTERSLVILPVFLVVLCLNIVFDLIIAFFRGANDEVMYASANPIRLLVVLALSFIVCFFMQGDVLFNLAIVWAASFLLLFVYLGAAIYKYPKLFCSKLPQENFFRKIFRYGSFVVLSGGASFLLTQIDVVMITFFLGVKMTGLYQIALPLATIVLVFIQPMASFLFPMVSKLHHTSRSKSVDYLLGAAYNLGFFILLPVSVIMIVFAPTIIYLMFGAEYSLATYCARILAAGFVLKGMAILNFAVLDGIGMVVRKTKLFYFGAFLNIVLNILFIMWLGIEGAAIATTLTFGTMFILSVVSIRSKGHVIRFNNWPKIIFSNVLLMLVMMLLERILFLNVYIESMIILGAGAIVYLSLGYF
ncbi:MAG: flippase, partial [Candidatus Nanoarchaeia archaeon]